MHLSRRTDDFGALSGKNQPRQNPRAVCRLSVRPETPKSRRAFDEGFGPAALAVGDPRTACRSGRARARARGAMMPCVSLPLPPAAAVAPIASAWGGGLLLLPFAAFAVARTRRGRPHALAAAAAPHRLPVPVPAPVGGAGRDGATHGGRFETAAELGWPLPIWGRQRPVLLAHPCAREELFPLSGLPVAP